MLPAVELHFDYISKDKRRRCYVLLDDDPHQALQVNKPPPRTHTPQREESTEFFNIPFLSSLAVCSLLLLSCFKCEVTSTPYLQPLVPVEQPPFSASCHFLHRELKSILQFMCFSDLF